MPTWGQATLFRLGTDHTFSVSSTSDGDTCHLEFGRELVCELRPHGEELENHWRFGVHQLLEVPVPATMHYALRMFVYKPTGATVTVELKTSQATEIYRFPEEMVAEGEYQLVRTAPLVLVHGGHPAWLEVRARRVAGAGQVLVTLDALALTVS